MVLAACSTNRPIIARDMRQVLRTSAGAIQFPTINGDTYRLDPNSQIRFLLRTGEATPWIRGRDIWRSELGLSFKDRGDVYLIGWEEVAAAEVSNLSGAKTYGVILLVGALVAVVVLVVLSQAKGGGGGGGGKIGGIPGLGGKSRARFRPISGRALNPHRALGLRHIHIPIYIALRHGSRDTYRDSPPPPPPYAPPVAPRPASDEPGVSPPGASPASAPATSGVVDIDEEPAPPAAAPVVAPPRHKPGARVQATPLFGARARRRSMIQFMASAGAGTELVRLHNYTGSLVAGIRIRDLLEIGGGLRHTMDPRVYGQTGEMQSGVVGFGRAGFHFWVDDRHRFALPLSVDVGAGHNVRLHFRLNYGLRFAPMDNLWIGLMPFNASYSSLDEEVFKGTERWTFPSTLEIGFNY